MTNKGAPRNDEDMDYHGLRPRNDGGRRFVIALLWLTLSLLSGTAHAQNALCALPDASTAEMLAAVPACQKDALFLARLGQVLNRAGRYLEAADHLERALMLDASLKDAQLSYAIALAGSGDTLAANALLENLLADPAMPPALHAQIARQKLAFSAAAGMAAAPVWQSRFTLGVRLGYDSNLLGSPNLGTLSLTLADQTLVLPLDASYLAQGGRYLRADAQLDAQRDGTDGTRWNALASARSRHSPALAQAGSSQLDLLLERSQHNASAANPDAIGHYASLNASTLDSNTGTRYGSVGVAAGAAWGGAAALGCQSRLGLEAQQRSYAGNPVLDGRYRGVAAFWSCEQGSGAQWLLGLKSGFDVAPDRQRPGGDQRQSSLRLGGFVATGQMPRAWAARLPGAMNSFRRGGVLLDYELSWQTDASGYSPVIDSGATRRVVRRAARIEYQQPLSATTLWRLGAEKIVQTSNLALFGQASWGAYSGLRVSW